MHTGEKKYQCNKCDKDFTHDMHNTDIMDNTIDVEDSQYTVG